MNRYIRRVLYLLVALSLAVTPFSLTRARYVTDIASRTYYVLDSYVWFFPWVAYNNGSQYMNEGTVWQWQAPAAGYYGIYLKGGQGGRGDGKNYWAEGGSASGVFWLDANEWISVWIAQGGCREGWREYAFFGGGRVGSTNGSAGGNGGGCSIAYRGKIAQSDWDIRSWGATLYSRTNKNFLVVAGGGGGGTEAGIEGIAGGNIHGTPGESTDTLYATGSSNPYANQGGGNLLEGSGGDGYGGGGGAGWHGGAGGENRGLWSTDGAGGGGTSYLGDTCLGNITATYMTRITQARTQFYTGSAVQRSGNYGANGYGAIVYMGQNSNTWNLSSTF